MVGSVASTSPVLVNWIELEPFELDCAATGCFNVVSYSLPGKGMYPRAGVLSVCASACEST